MKSLGFNKKTIILILSILIVTSFIFLLAINLNKQLSEGLPPIVTFSPSPKASFIPTISQEPSNGVGPNTDPEVARRFQEDLVNQQKFIESQERITKLISTLPYSGNNFSLSYDIETNQFILTLNQNNRSLGQQEFDQFLISRNIQKQYMEIVSR